MADFARRAGDKVELVAIVHGCGDEVVARLHVSSAVLAVGDVRVDLDHCGSNDRADAAEARAGAWRCACIDGKRDCGRLLPRELWSPPPSGCSIRQAGAAGDARKRARAAHATSARLPGKRCLQEGLLFTP